MNNSQISKLTIVSLSYNHEKYLAHTLESFVSQKTAFPFEVIIADDASTDNTQSIIIEYAQKFPDIIRPVLREKNIGAEENWFDALSRVHSEYVIYSDGDDYFTDPFKLQKQVDFLDNHPECSICFHPVSVTIEGAPDLDSIFPTPQMRGYKSFFELEDILVKNFIQTNSCMYRWAFNEKSSLTDIFPKNIMPGDWYLHMLHSKLGKIGFIDEVMAVYRRHAGGVWWESLFDLDSLHLKHGVSELKFYIAVEKLIMNGDIRHHGRIVHFAKYLMSLYLQHQKHDLFALIVHMLLESHPIPDPWIRQAQLRSLILQKAHVLKEGEFVDDNPEQELAEHIRQHGDLLVVKQSADQIVSQFMDEIIKLVESGKKQAAIDLYLSKRHTMPPVAQLREFDTVFARLANPAPAQK